MVYTCVLDLDGKFQKKTVHDTVKEAQSWAVTHAQIVPGVGKYTVSIYDEHKLIKTLF